VEVLQKAKAWSLRREAAALLGKLSTCEESTLDALWSGLLDSHSDVRTHCAQALALLGHRFPKVSETIAAKLIVALQEPAFAQPDTRQGRTGHDYAFDGLWALVSGRSA
jgi:hypothetical protein